MKDLRNHQSNILFRGKTIVSNNNIENKIGEMMSFLGVKSNKNLVQQACGYLSMNNMEPNINNLETFLKNQNNMINTADLRKSAGAVMVNQSVNDPELFINKMKEKGYKTLTNRFLVKKFNYENDEIEIDISINKGDRNIESISAYKESQILDEVPKDILSQVDKDIDNCLF